MAGTSLAEQLKKLAAPQTSIFVHTKKKPSLLFDPKDAADIDRETFYRIGLSGLEELKAVDPRLAEFERSLFDETSLHLERAVEDFQANAKLDQLINRFLIFLSPYLNLKASHKALEWLICRFHIHQYNTDSLMGLFLPYHDTNIFARLVQILPLQDKGGRWIWLQPLKKEGVPMSKLFLLSKVSSDTSVLKFISNLPLQAVQVHGEKSGCLTSMFAFYCTTLLGALDQTPQVSEVQITHMLPSLLAGISSVHLDFTAAAYMILGHLVTKIHLSPGILAELFYKVCRSEAASLRLEAALVLVVMSQTHSLPPVLPAVKHLASVTWFLPALDQLTAASVVVYPLVAAVASDCLAAISGTEVDEHDKKMLQEFLKNLLQQSVFNNEEAGNLLKLFADTTLSYNQWYHDTLHQLEKSYPEAFDMAVRVHPSLLGLIPGYTARNELFQRFNHPESSVRLEAIKHVKDHPELLKEDWVKEALASRLSDSKASVISAVLALGCSIPQSKLVSTVSRCWHASDQLYTLAPVMLSMLDSDITLLLLALPFLLPKRNDKHGAATAKVMLNCASIQKYELMQPLCKKLAVGSTTERSLTKEVFKFIHKQLKSLKTADVVKAGKRLWSHGAVYQLMTLLTAAGTLEDQLITSDVEPLLALVAEYSSTPVSAKVPDELTEENIAAVVSSCRNGQLPFQGSLCVLTAIMERLEPPVVEGRHIYSVREPNVAIVIDVFRLVVKMKKSTSEHISKAYASFCNKMFEKSCGGSIDRQVDLLSNIVLGCPDLTADCIERLQQLVDGSTSVSEHALVPALITALHSEDSHTRTQALRLVHSLTQKLASPATSYHKLLDLVSQHQQEIATDHEQVNVVLYMSLSPDPSVQSLLDKPTRQTMALLLNSLMDIVVDANVPAYARAALLTVLDQINSQSLLDRLLPVAMMIVLGHECSAEELRMLQAIVKRINVTTASAFNNNYVWTFIEACLSDNRPKNNGTAAVLVLQQIDRELFASLSPPQQERLLSLIIGCAAETEGSHVTSAAASCVKRLVLDGATLATLLEPMRNATTQVPQPIKKRGWTVKQPPPLELLTSTPWKRGLCLLEFIQNKKKLDNVQQLLPSLFEILNKCLKFEEQSPVEYTKQVLLTSLLHCCLKLPPDTELPENSVQVELVVECIRASPNPQTHHHALLLLAHTAGMIPDRVLHSIMPVFTFMGSSLLRQDDAYSFQIISKIVETIVPVLLKSGEDYKLSPEVVGVLRVFATALLDIPEHRRMPLFTKLLNTLSQGHFLYAFLCLVFESHILHPTDSSAVKEPGSIPKRLEVGLQLCHQFPPSTILSGCCQLLSYLCELPVDKNSKDIESFKKSKLAALFNVEESTDKQYRHYKYTVLTFLSLLLSSKQFLNLVAALTMEEIHEMRGTFEKMFEGILTFTQLVSKQVNLSVGQLTAKYWKSMFNICFDVLAKTNALLPADMFLAVVSSLLRHELPSLRCKALELLNWRLQQAQPMDTAQLLTLLPSLLCLVKDGESTITQQTALLSVKCLARQLAAEHPGQFQEAMKAAAKIVRKHALQDSVLASAILCVGELCHSMGAHAISSLPSFMPAIIKILQYHKQIASGDLLLPSLVSAVNKIVDSLAGFLSPYLDQLLEHLSSLSADCSKQTDNPKLQPVLQKMKAIKLKLSTDVPLRVLLPAVSESYNRMVAPDSPCVEAVPPLLSLLADSFRSGQTLTPELTAFFLSALDYRCVNQALSEADVTAVESAVIASIIALVFKLSESSFRPFYYKIFNWSFRSDAHKDRCITFYKLTSSIADSLKGLFVSFTHYFLKNAASLLDENNTAKQSLDWDTHKAEVLVNAILQSLLTVFLHDATHFVNKERFDTLMQPLVDQLENSLGGEARMEERTTQKVIPCLTQMAVSAADDTLWKQLNYQILLKTRHTNSQVRVGGALAVCEVAKKLGEEFLPLLPETVPFLAELLEDEDENVEKTSRRVVQELEAALGEPISKYF